MNKYFSYIDELNFLSLSFKNPNYEHLYLELIRKRLLKTMYYQITVIFTILTLFYILEFSFLDHELVFTLIKISINIVCYFLGLLYIAKIRKYLNVLIFLINILISIFFNYVLKEFNDHYQDLEKVKTNSLFIYSFLYLKYTVFYNQNWILASLEMVFGFIYLFFKVEINFNFNAFSMFFLSIIWLSVFVIYFNEKNKKISFFENMTAKNLVEKYQYLLKEVDPEINILLKYKREPTNKFKQSMRKMLSLKNGNTKKLEDSFPFEIEYVNSIAKEKYDLENKELILSFFDKIFLKEENNYKKKEEKSIKTYLQNMLDPLSSRNSTDLSMAKRYNCYRREESKEFRLLAIFCLYIWKSEIYILIRLNDLQLEKEVEELRELDKYKDQLLANITHDLRTPLNGMIYFIHQVKEIAKEEEIIKSLNYAEINGNLLMNLINDILDHSLISSNKMRLSVSRFNLRKIINETIILLKPNADHQSIQLKLNFCCQNDLIVESDPIRLKQVLINIMGNAIKFTQTGFVVLKVYKNTKNYINFEIIDSGIGMSTKTIQSLGKPFSTFDTDGLNKKGIGLGLMISKEIIGKLGPSKTIFISSIQGKGTKFGFIIYRSLELKENVGIQKEKLLKCMPKDHKQFTFERIDIKKQYTDISNEPNELDFSDNILQNEKIKEFSEFEIKNLEEDSLVNFNTEAIDEKIEEEQSSPSSMKVYLEKRNKKKTTTMVELNSAKLKPSKLKLTLIEKIKKNMKGSNINLKILIVDDNMFNILIMEQFLKKMNIEEIKWETACNGAIALNKFKENNEKNKNKTPFNLIIMDCEMPIMNGFEASVEINKLIENEDFIDCLIIACSALNTDEEIKKCIENGMKYFLMKPCTETDLFKIIYDCWKDIRKEVIFDVK